MNQLKRLWARITGALPLGHELYEGPYHSGRARYAYYLGNDNQRIFDGPFRYLYAYNDPIGSKGREEAHGNFVDGRKEGQWLFVRRGANKHMRLLVNYEHGHANGVLQYELYATGLGQNHYKTRIVMDMKNGRPVGSIHAVVNGLALHGGCDADSMANGKWIMEPFEGDNAGNSLVETWKHGVCVKAERVLGVDGRRREVEPSICQRFNLLLDDVYTELLCIVQRGTFDGRPQVLQVAK